MKNYKLPAKYLTVVADINEKFNNYDSKAIEEQKEYKRYGSSIFIISFIMLTMIAFASIFYNHIPAVVFIFEIAFLILILILFSKSRKNESHKNWINNRLKAEKLRILKFSLLGGVSIVLEEEEFYKSYLDAAEQEVNSLNIDDVIEYLDLEWLKDQNEHHHNKLNDYEKKERLIKSCIGIAFAGAIVVAILHLTIVGELASKILTFLTIFLPFLGATLVGINSQREFGAIALNSKVMIEKIPKFRSDLEKINNYNELNKFIKDVVIFFDTELLRWEILIRAKAIELSL